MYVDFFSLAYVVCVCNLSLFKDEMKVEMKLNPKLNIFNFL